MMKYILLNLALLLTVALNGQSTVKARNTIPANDIVERKLVQEKPTLPYAPIREADILWEKRIWRVIDTREKMNLAFRYPEKPFFSILHDAIKAEEISAYSVEKDDFTILLEDEDLESMLFRCDTLEYIDPETYEPILQVVCDEPNMDDIKRFRVQELWYFDNRTSTLKVRILGIAPLKEEYDDNGNFRFERPLFWVSFAECRALLAKETVFNNQNDKGLMTWEDLFETRQFASYIYKASNIHDRRLQDYLSGPDLLLEADKIKMEIFNWEHDLWSY